MGQKMSGQEELTWLCNWCQHNVDSHGLTKHKLFCKDKYELAQSEQSLQKHKQRQVEVGPSVSVNNCKHKWYVFKFFLLWLKQTNAFPILAGREDSGDYMEVEMGAENAEGKILNNYHNHLT